MMTITKIKIATEFSEYPAGRYPTDGNSNGQRFREEFLVPAFAVNERVIIDLDGTDGYGSSFLEEAFGGLVRHHGYSVEKLQNRLEFIANDDDSFIEEIWDYIRDGAAH